MPSSSSSASAFEICTDETDRSSWHPKIAALFLYWRSIAPAGALPGRQHFEPLAVPHLLSNIWILDVVGPPHGYKFRIFGTHLVDGFGADLTGRYFDVAHADSPNLAAVTARLNRIAGERIALRGKDRTLLFPDKRHVIVEVLNLPLARDGATVDMILSLSILLNASGKEI